MNGNNTEALIANGLLLYDLGKNQESQRLVDKDFIIEPAYMKILSDFGIPFSNITENEQGGIWLERLLLVPPERIRELVTSNRSHVLEQILDIS